MIRIKHLIRALQPERADEIEQKLPKTIAETILNGAAIDSRQIISGALFVAIQGERTDGHHFVAGAFENKASAALIQFPNPDYPVLDLRAGVETTEMPDTLPCCILVDHTIEALQTIARYWRKELNLRVIGITGSVGKSTTKELVSNVLSQRYRTLKNRGNLNNEIGLPLTILDAGLGHERAVLEMGFYVPGEITFLCDIAKPQIGLVTNIGTVHAERAGSQEVIAQGKSELIQSLPVDGVAILNYDDPYVRDMAKVTKARVLYYGLDRNADLWADQIEGMGLDGIRFRIHYQKQTVYIQVPLIGRHSVHTALRAAAVGLVEGLDWEEIINGLQKSHTQLRLVATKAQNGALILDDSYNAAPESVLAALNLLAEINYQHPRSSSPPRKVAVLGEMYELGQYEQTGHELVGRRAAEVCDVLVTVGDRSKIIAEAAHSAGMRSEDIHWLTTVPETTDFLKTSLRENDVVLIKGSHGLRMDRITWALETADD